MNKHKFLLDTKPKIYSLCERLSSINPNNPDQPTYLVTVEPYKGTRSNAQNRLYWMWMKEVRDGYNDSYGKFYSDRVWHKYFVKLFLGVSVVEVRGEFIQEEVSTTTLNTKEFTDYLELVNDYCAQELGILLTEPEDLFNKAMGRERERVRETDSGMATGD